MGAAPSALVDHGQVDASPSGPTPPLPRASGQHHTPGFVINGRFYGQRITGVQRYGREIVRALQPLVAERGGVARLALPRGAVPPSPTAFVELRTPGRMPGHVWEQGALPFAGSGPVLNLCNTGPVLRRRQIVCLHDANAWTWPDSYSRGFRLFYRALQPLLARRAAVVTTVSHASAADLARHLGLDRRRIVVLPNGHEHALRWRIDGGALRRIPRQRPFVLLLGSRARHKNAGLLLRLAPTLDDLGLDLVVTGGSDAIFATEDGGPAPAENVHRLGHVSDDELAGLMAEALCLAFPSWTEGFGLPIVEAMARGCPVIASDRASMPEVCGRAALLAAPDAPEAWRDAIVALQRSPALWADLAGRGAEQARRFSWTASARGYLDLVDRLS